MNKNVLDTDLSGKVAVVTGAGGVLCSAFAKTLARAGAKVALLDLNEEAAQSFADEITAEGGVAKAYKCNVLDKAVCYEVADAVEPPPIRNILKKATSTPTPKASLTWTLPAWSSCSTSTSWVR